MVHDERRSRPSRKALVAQTPPVGLTGRNDPWFAMRLDQPSASRGSLPDEAIDMLIAREQELLKLEEQRIQSLDTQSTAVLTVVVAIAAFAASAVDGDVLEDHVVVIAAPTLLMLVSVGFAIAARGPRSLKWRIWKRLNPDYGYLEDDLRRAEDAIWREQHTVSQVRRAVLENWRARTQVSAWLAEQKARGLSWALVSLLAAFVAAGLAALVIVT